MADELTVSLAVRYNKGGTDLTFPFSGSPFSIDITGTNYIVNRQIVGSTEEALVLGDVDVSANGAWMIAVNRDGTNNVRIRHGTGLADLILLRPGEACMFLMHTTATAPFVISSAGSPELEYALIEA